MRRANVAIIYKIDNNYYASWYNNNGVAYEKIDPDCVYLESKIINELGVTKVEFSNSYWNE